MDNYKIERILIVDDDQNITLTLKDLLKKEYSPHIAHNGKDGLTFLAKRDFDVDLIILDLMMPEMDGFTFLNKMKNKLSEIPVLIISARVDPLSKIHSLDLGAWTFINKPFNNKALLAQVKVLLKLRGYIKDNNNRAHMFDEISKRLESELINVKKELSDIKIKHSKNISQNKELHQSVMNTQKTLLKIISQQLQDFEILTTMHLIGKPEIELTEKYNKIKRMLNEFVDTLNITD